jgi:DNA helicase-2/ATP-dependent DNA helicase PcrA
MPELDDILADLNPPQREAVETVDGPLLILAGAGSGKTRVVTRRIAYLITKGVRPWQILAITFTNKAAGEMRRRVNDLVGASGAWISTFHSFCARILRREAPALGLSPEFSIYDEDDSLSVLREIIKELQFDDKRYSAGNLRQSISRLKNAGQRPQDITGNSLHKRILQQVYEMYQQRLLKNQALDFDDLLLTGLALLRDHRDVLTRYRGRFRYVLVDEYQDTNACQYQLVKLLGEEHRNVCSTGDPDQSIYAWRGADVRNILSFQKDFPEAKVVRLEQNYRSTQGILSIASAVIRHNQDRMEKKLWTAQEGGETPVSVTLDNDELEATEVVSRIRKAVDAGRRYSDIAIFYRTNAQSRGFETALIRAALPYQLVGGTPFYERREVKDALAYLRLIVNPADDVSFKRIINVPRRGLGDSTVEALSAEADRRGCPLTALLKGSAWLESALKPKPRAALRDFAKLLDACRLLPAYPVTPLVEFMLQESGLHAALEKAGEDERIENLEQLLNAAAVYDRENAVLPDKPDGPPPEPGAFDGLDEMPVAPPSLSGFLENAALVQSTDTWEDDSDRITLMTLHMAKGLEFPVVFLAGLEDGLLPLIRMRTDPFSEDEYDPETERRTIEEERRLFYVGVTRAREELCLLRTRFRMRYGRSEISRPSRFLGEIPPNLILGQKDDDVEDLWATSARTRGPLTTFAPEVDDEPDPVPAERAPGQGHPVPGRKPTANQDWAVDYDSSQLESNELEVGARVHHAKFGDGVVEELSGQGLSSKARVRFRSGSRLLLLAYAQLRKL